MTGNRMFLMTGLIVGLASAAAAWSDDPPSDPRRPREGPFTRLSTLVPTHIRGQLNLDAAQQGQIDQIESEFRERRRQMLIKSALQFYSALERTDDEEAPVEPAPAIGHEVTGGLLETARIRADYEGRVLAVLNDQQKDAYRRLKNTAPPRGPVHETRKPKPTAGHHDLMLFLGPVQDQLGLTDDQRQRVIALRSETEFKLRAILSEDQRRKYESLIDEIKKEPVRERRDRPLQRKNKEGR